MEFPISSTQHKHAQKLINLNIITSVDRQSTAAVSGVLSRILREHYTITEHVGCCVHPSGSAELFQATLEIFQIHSHTPQQHHRRGGRARKKQGQRSMRYHLLTDSFEMHISRC